jgi:hypothetical protein
MWVSVKETPVTEENVVSTVVVVFLMKIVVMVVWMTAGTRQSIAVQRGTYVVTMDLVVPTEHFVVTIIAAISELIVVVILVVILSHVKCV